MIARFLAAQTVIPAIALASLAAIAINTPAQAQFGEAAGIAEAMTPDVLSRDVATFSKGLELDETQRVIIEALYHDYDDAFEANVEKMKARFEEMRQDLVQEDPRRVLALVFTPFAELGQDKAKIYEQFINNVKVVLTTEQMAMWPAFERQLLREKEMSKGRLSGESIDLFIVLRDLHFDDTVANAAQPVLDQYDLELDKALRDRKAIRAKIQPEMLRAMAEQDGTTSMDLFEKMIAKQVAVRDVNDRFIDAVAHALPADEGQKFRFAALERAYPRVFRETPAQRLFVSARELEGLTPELMTVIGDLEKNFLLELAAMNENLLLDLRQWDPVEQRQHAANFASHWQGGQTERKADPTRDSFLKRDELAKKYVKSLQSILTPEQFGLLPGSYRWLTDVEPTKVAPNKPPPTTPNSATGSSGMANDEITSSSPPTMKTSGGRRSRGD